MAKLDDIAAAKLEEVPREAVEPFLGRLIEEVGSRASAVVLYGSCLSPLTRSPTSIPDFYVVVPSYRTFHPSWFHAAMNWILPPNIYHFSCDERPAKYNVISEKDLRAATSQPARDVYHLGRFSKRIAIGWAFDEASRQLLREVHISAIRSVLRRIYFSLPETFSLSDVIHASLASSYWGEFRVEAENKVDRLYQAEREYYEQVYSTAIEEMQASPWNIQRQDSNHFSRPVGRFFDLRGRWRLNNFIRRSRVRAKLRWPKGVVTVSNWTDYLIAKIERTHGIKIVLNERERKFPLIFGWKYFFRLRKKNILK